MSIFFVVVDMVSVVVAVWVVLQRRRPVFCGGGGAVCGWFGFL